MLGRALTFVFLIVSNSAYAECKPVDHVLNILETKHSEKKVAVRRTTEGLLILMAKKDFSGWTIVPVDKQGQVCELIYGFEWDPKNPLGSQI